MSDSNSNSSSDVPQTINGYLSAFITMVTSELPAEEPGAPTTSELLGVYVGKQNKRQIYIYIRTGPAEILRVGYMMPVPAKYARIFKQPAGRLVPHEEPTFSRPLAIDAATLNVASWNDEIARVTGLEADAEAGSVLSRTLQGLLLYWNYMRTQLLGLMELAHIKAPQVMMGLAPAVPVSDPATVQKSATGDPQSGGRRRTRRRRRLSHRR